MISHATPRSNIVVQACGKAHLGNFGIFATPERDVVFDVNDFDETLPDQWAWPRRRSPATEFGLLLEQAPSPSVAGRHRSTGHYSQRARAGPTRADASCATGVA
jgi:hypothetical protein